ncbi:MAG: hypothetical protein ABIT76_00890 [Chthoniobacterales bacterium]
MNLLAQKERSLSGITPYQPALQDEWDRCIDAARNGAFWFRRAYLDYHSERFHDASFLFRNRKGNVIAVLPAHCEGNELRSHGGLPFAGLIVAYSCSLEDIETIFSLLAERMRSHGWTRLIYAAPPYPYASQPHDETLYVLEKLGARRLPGKLTAMIHLRGKNMADFFSRHRRSAVRSASNRHPYVFTEEKNLALVWPELERFLERRHGSRPVHSLEEITRLQEAFPESIRLLVARRDGRLAGGQLFYLFDNVLRCQYVFRTESSSNDYLFLRLDLEACQMPGWQRDWLDLGTSINPATGLLNNALYRNKEYCGARGICLHTWQWDID